MESLLSEIRKCEVCKDGLPHGCRPIVNVSTKSKILIIGQAPGRRVHESGIPWDDPSGDNLRKWLGVSKDQFYVRKSSELCRWVSAFQELENRVICLHVRNAPLFGMIGFSSN